LLQSFSQIIQVSTLVRSIRFIIILQYMLMSKLLLLLHLLQPNICISVSYAVSLVSGITLVFELIIGITEHFDP
jgi:hypothetical protein